jgi:hypothetical protein
VAWWIVPYAALAGLLLLLPNETLPGFLFAFLFWQVLFTQISLMGMVAVLSSERFSRRLGWLAGFCLLNSLVLQASVLFCPAVEHFFDSFKVPHPWAIVPLSVLISQFPYWLVRFIEGWRMVAAADDNDAVFVDRSVRLGDFLVTIGLVSVGLACARVAAEGGAWIGAFLGITAGFVGLIISFPLAILFLERENTKAAWWAALLIYPGLGLLPYGFLVYAWLVESRTQAIQVDEFWLGLPLILIAGPLLMPLLLAGPLHSLRKAGWRLRRVYARPKGADEIAAASYRP